MISLSKSLPILFFFLHIIGNGFSERLIALGNAVLKSRYRLVLKKIFALIRLTSSTGNAATSGLPAANGIIAGSAVAFNISRIADG